MMNLRFNFCFLVLFTTLFISTHCLGPFCLPEKHVALFIFGDSVFDSGNNNYINTITDYQANYEPYGENFFKYSSGRFSDGRIIPDFIAEFAKLPFITPYLHPDYHHYTDGANFASAGAGALAETHQGLVVDLKTQLSNFKNLEKLLRKKLGDAEAKTLLFRSVYLISIGSNDYASVFTRNSNVFQSSSQKEYVDMVIGNLTFVIKEIYKKGGRKFGFPNMAPLGCVPLLRAINPGNKWNQELTTLAELHNKALSEVLQKLENDLDGFKYSIADTFTSLSERINNPLKYGFKEGSIACCGTGPFRGINSCGGKRSVKEYELCENAGEYVFFDTAHPTEKLNQQLAELMWSGTLDVVGPYNLKALFELI
ncbi:GDSL esterase/lipase 1-like [Fagus crenata]